ncbi:glycosyltransferase [Mangrovimonas spongiae]|uniref:Glycosyltransferase n=1 Tax=Mangrovimonas spongiae TaxID=2494697 RepID=A0A428JYX0_9FLAO|nr:glycosyltransferase family 4 protein [Mangrovimonas spongiae]RSK39352.1 glycosyltransferase [Mangrovimonas spongiae]
MKHKLLIIGFVWPEPKSSAAGSRMMQLIAFFLSHNYDVTFATTTKKTQNAFNLEQIGIHEVEVALNNSSFDDFLAELKPDIVLFDRFLTEEQFSWRVAECCPNAIRILDTEDLHFLRKGRQQAFKDKELFNDDYLYNDTAKREIASILRCDLSLLISEYEMALLQERFHVDASLLLYLPFMLNSISNKALKKLPRYQSRDHFITVGTFLHEPNYQSVLYLKQTIWPKIKAQLPNAELHIYGAYQSQKVTQLHNIKEGFLIKGFVDDLDTVMQSSRVCLAPLQFGAGLKGKLIDAMRNGTPCAMSTIAAEGMFGTSQPNGFVSDDVNEFVEKTIQLYSQESFWEESQKNGFNVLEQRFCKYEHQDNFWGKLKVIKSNLKSHRQDNFLGSILQHHLHQSTKFMSKWIEEKNK